MPRPGVRRGSSSASSSPCCTSTSAILFWFLQESLEGWRQGRKDLFNIDPGIARNFMEACAGGFHREPSELSGTAVAEP